MVSVLLKVDAILGDGCEIWEHLHSFWELKYLQGYPKTLWTAIKTYTTPPLLVELWVPNQGNSQSAGSQWMVITGYNQWFAYANIFYITV